jgi:pimeloyl-ACP methyl ester carboxylesterase
VKSKDADILHYKVTGHGPVIVLLHGYLSSGKYWENIRTSLEKNHTVITIDLLGFGQSPKPKDSRYDYDDHLAWIKRTLDYAQIKEPVLLVGHSMGSLLALRYSTQYPGTTSRLILANLPFFKDREEAHRELSSTSLFFRASLYWQLHRLFVPIMRTKGMKRVVRQVASTKYKGMEEYMFTSSSVARTRSLHNVIEAQTTADDLGQLAVPTTIIVGSQERRAYVKNIKQAQKRHSLHVITADTGHHTPLEDPELVVTVLQQK